MAVLRLAPAAPVSLESSDQSASTPATRWPTVVWQWPLGRRTGGRQTRSVRGQSTLCILPSSQHSASLQGVFASLARRDGGAIRRENHSTLQSCARNVPSPVITSTCGHARRRSDRRLELERDVVPFEITASITHLSLRVSPSPHLRRYSCGSQRPLCRSGVEA